METSELDQSPGSDGTVVRLPAAGSLPDDLIGTKATATILRVDRRSVLRYCKAGLLKSYPTLGGRHRYSEAEVRALIAAQAAQAAGVAA